MAVKMAPLTVDCSITLPGQARIPVIDQAMELSKLMTPTCPPEEVSRLLISAARTWEMATAFVVKPTDHS